MTTTLGRLLEAIDTLDPEATIYAPAARPLSPGAPALLVDGPRDGPNELEGLTYLLEVHLARDVRDVWRQWRDGRIPTTAELVEAVVFYADNDAYLPPSGPAAA